MGSTAQTTAKSPSALTSVILQASTAICLAVSLIASGLFVCAVPRMTTELLSRAFSVEANSPFTEDELVAAAVATRDYTVGDNDQVALYTALGDINVQCAQDNRSGAGAPDLSAVPFADGRYDLTALKSALSKASERYTLDQEAISHLDDVNVVVKTAEAVFCIIAAAAAVGLIACAIKLGRKATSRVLRMAAIAVAAIFAGLAVWVALDFDGFFTFFHSLFFADGTWVFSYDSLLITMYPPEFWIGMGAVWLATTLAGCALCLIIGQLLKMNRVSKRKA